MYGSAYKTDRELTMNVIGEQIKTNRIAKGVTADELARALPDPKDRQTVYAWQRGDGAPAGENLLWLIANGYVAAPVSVEASPRPAA